MSRLTAILVSEAAAKEVIVFCTKLGCNVECVFDKPYSIGRFSVNLVLNLS